MNTYTYFFLYSNLIEMTEEIAKYKPTMTKNTRENRPPVVDIWNPHTKRQGYHVISAVKPTSPQAHKYTGCSSKHTELPIRFLTLHF